MAENKNKKRGSLLFLVIVMICILSWITYGNIEGVFGTLAYLIVGLLNLYPWAIPFVGIPLGILDFLGIFGFGMWQGTLSIAHLNLSWLPILWYWLVSLVAMVIDIFLMYLTLSWLRGLKYRKKEPKADLALVNCNIIDGNRDSKVITDGVILIKNIVMEGENSGLITAVGKAGDVKIPADYKTIDLNGEYILPGLINAHCLVIMSGKPRKMQNMSDERMGQLVKLTEIGIVQKLVKKVMFSNINNALNAGVTTLRGMGDVAYLDVKLSEEVAEGKIIGPRLVVAGKTICTTGGHGGPAAIVCDSIPEVRKAIRTSLRKRVSCIKIINTGGVMDAEKIGEAGRPQMTVEEIETACFESHRGNLLVASHCESTKGIEEALEGGVDTIEHGADIPDDLFALFKNNPKSLRGYSAVIPTLSAGMGLSTLPIEDTMITPIKFENAKLIEKGMIKSLQVAYKNGIRFGCGTDAGVPYSTHYNVWKELKYYLKYTDMTAQEAIYFATKNTAEIIGVDDVTGSIEVGKSADLQVVPGNPLENIDVLGQVSKVVIMGHLIKNPKVKKVKKLKEITPIEL